MVYIELDPGDNLQRVLRTFRRKVARAGVFTDLKKHRHYQKPSEKRKHKARIARRRARQRQNGR